ncbi:MAG: alpha/beta fold hydrolase [Pseudomonadales bacterium]|nr:alpha/beta fold hydrolase [Pseudomonadales bacterium]
MPASTRLEIEGPAGSLEANMTEAEASIGVTAILCHPHPLYGGSMQDAVLETSASVLLDHGVGCLRFNFRGVGASTGQHDKGIGEVDDLAAVHGWVSREYPDHKIWLLGYSFGANVVWRAKDALNPAHTILVAPPVGAMEFTESTNESSVYAIAGDRDDFVKEANLQKLMVGQAHIIAGADHFFSGHHRELVDAVGQAIAPALR